MRFSFILFTITMIFANSCALAAGKPGDCSTQDFRPSMATTYDQGDSGWCFAHSVAACLSQVMGKKISPGEIALDAALASPQDLKNLTDPDSQAYLAAHPDMLADIANDHKQKDHYSYPKVFQYTASQDKATPGPAGFSMSQNGIMDIGGSEDFALLLAKAHGVCDYNKFPSGDKPFIRDLDSMMALYKKEKKAAPTCPQSASDQSLGTSGASVGRTTKASSEIVTKTIRDWVATKCGKLDKVPDGVAPQVVKYANDIGTFNKKFKKATSARAQAQSKLYDEINANFNRGRISAIGYDYCEHGAPDEDSGICEKRSKKKGVAAQPEADHSGILTARKMIKGQCKFFLQTHSGSTCDGYLDRYSSSPICEKQYGGIWISPDQLKSIYSVFSIK